MMKKHSKSKIEEFTAQPVDKSRVVVAKELSGDPDDVIVVKDVLDVDLAEYNIDVDLARTEDDVIAQEC